MLPRLDWKFFVTLLATIAGVVVPVWIWQIDLTSKSISMKVISSTELRPTGTPTLDSIQVLVDGRTVVNPYISVLEIQNNGSKPIPSGDFESPLELFVRAPATVVKAEVTKRTPLDLQPKMVGSGERLLINPLLLNPKDTIQLTVLTASEAPSFSVRARISGVTEISISGMETNRAARRQWLTSTVGILLLVLYVNLLTDFVYSLLRRIYKLWHLASAIVTCFGGILLAAPPPISETAVSEASWTKLAIAAAISFPILLIRLRGLRRAA